MKREGLKAFGWAALITGVLAVLIVVGSRNLRYFDASLVAYTFATLFAVGGITYRYALWLQRPPTSVYWRRGWQTFFARRHLLRNLGAWVKRVVREFALNLFIYKRHPQRWMFFSFRADVMTPPYWINMGALAIATLAGSRLILAADRWPFLQQLAPFVTGMTLLFWAVATWWIPLLAIVGIWRHVVKRVPLAYDPQYWALVFPLGMYTVATFVWIEASGLAVLRVIPQMFVYIALLAWLATFAGLVARLLRSLLRPARLE